MIPASHPLVGPSLRLQLGAAKLLGGRGWLRDDARARRSIDFAGELISNCASGPNYFNNTHSAATVAAQETAFGRAGTLYGGMTERIDVYTRRRGENIRGGGINEYDGHTWIFLAILRPPPIVRTSRPVLDSAAFLGERARG